MLRTARIDKRVGVAFIEQHHYSRNCRKGAECFGLFADDELIGVAAFMSPGNEASREMVFGKPYKYGVTELHRLALAPGAEHGITSWFVRRALRWLKALNPTITAVLSYADSSEGHIGTVYQACGAIYFGRSVANPVFIDAEGRRRGHNQGPVHLRPEDAIARGWTVLPKAFKHRYVFLLYSSVKERKELEKRLRLKALPYPKRERANDEEGQV